MVLFLHTNAASERVFFVKIAKKSRSLEVNEALRPTTMFTAYISVSLCAFVLFEFEVVYHL